MRPQFNYYLTFTSHWGEPVTHRVARGRGADMLRILRQLGDPVAELEVRLVDWHRPSVSGGWRWAGMSREIAAQDFGEEAASSGRQAPSGFYIPEEDYSCAS